LRNANCEFKSEIRNPKSEIRNLLPPLLLAALLVLIYYPTFAWFWWRWFRSDSYYSHGILIPLISGFLIWRKRHEIPLPAQDERVEGRTIGLMILAVGLAIHTLSAWMRVHFTSGFSLVIVLIGTVIYLLGMKAFKAIWFPLLFLAFMVPAPMDLIAVLTLKLKLFAAQIGTWVVNLFVTTIREGSVVYLPKATVTIESPCSGLRSIISFLALGSLYAYISEGTRIRKAILLLGSIPVAVLANAVRVILIILIANRFGDQILTNELLHKGFGLMVFVLGLILFFLLAKSLNLRLALSPPSPAEDDPPSNGISIGLRQLIISAAMLGFVGLITFGSYSHRSDAGKLYTAEFPMVIGNWFGREVGMSKEVYEELETGDAIYREYRNPEGGSLDLVIVYSPENRKVTHPPDICFQGGGWEQQLKDTIPTPYGRKWGLSEVNRLILDRGGESKQIALYWYKIGHRQTSSYLDQQLRYFLYSLMHRSRGVALIRISSYAPDPGHIEPETKKLEEFAKLVMPLVAKILP